jgi:hypothetical protein
LKQFSVTATQLMRQFAAHVMVFGGSHSSPELCWTLPSPQRGPFDLQSLLQPP